MFEKCNNIAELNEARIAELKSGSPAILVNKEYAKRKAFLVSNDSRGFKRVRFVPVPIIEPEFVLGIDYAYEGDDEHTIYVVTEKMHG